MIDIWRRGIRVRIRHSQCCRRASTRGIRKRRAAGGCWGLGSRLGSVFTEKVLKRLFPNVSSGQEKGAPQTPALETPSQDVTPGTVQQKHAHGLTDGDIKIQPERRLYTVSLPPPGYIPCSPEPTSCADSENASSGGDAEDVDLPDQPKRRRIRRHKSKKKIKTLSDVTATQTDLETQQEKPPPPHPDAPAMSKNKRRKLKAKLRLRRKREAGVATRASGVTFTYQPESSEEAEAEEDVGAEDEEDPEQSAADSAQEDTELASSRADGVLSFLKSTQEIYFCDDTSRDDPAVRDPAVRDSAVCDPAVCDPAVRDPAVRVEVAEELLRVLESGHMPPTDILILDHMKTLLLLQDTERLKSALKMFPEHCVMPPDHARIISAFFNYWITKILPEESSE
ncbi:glutamate-rich protein 1 isoform X2 [Apodemus sylvaticus]|uniref:glutamate-rich protein 1 isoform X2 n=1 Tax=Apodemus sylvaticus TaxID=10129 RepID=UPI0022449E50|nr:glutamate-rich protein 1 isoform X2 [Apodemus sylvaticus]